MPEAPHLRHACGRKRWEERVWPLDWDPGGSDPGRPASATKCLVTALIYGEACPSYERGPRLKLCTEPSGAPNDEGGCNLASKDAERLEVCHQGGSKRATPKKACVTATAQLVP
jgi:hypothetical protein